ncbi:MAG: ROK family protein [Dictyoglomus sp.]|nr:ROK family protein [Dictyoglomus sp.]MCX7845470.1 ROK family protein [Dictyoglomaceae bacterium]MDW8187699.1 ROK family protein [Dictyoglomus sp.]
MERFLALDIGGTKIALGRFLGDGKLEEKIIFPTNAERGYRKILEEIIENLKKLKTSDTLALGIGCGGPLDSEKGVILSPPNLPGWDNVPLKGDLESALNIPVFLDNDANTACLGEYYFGAGRGVKNLVYITVSTGIGGGVIIDGKILRGQRNSAGEIGHQTILPHGPLCNCGNKGCLEALASGIAIAKRAEEAILNNEDTILKELSRKERISAELVRKAYLQGDKVSERIWKSALEYLGIGIGNVITILSPERIILGGGIMKAGEEVLETVKRVVKERVKLVPVDKVEILSSQLGEDVGLYGALALILSEIGAR